MTMTLETTLARIDDLLASRAQLVGEMANSFNPDPQWWKDRIGELGYYNRQLRELGVIPADAAL